MVRTDHDPDKRDIYDVNYVVNTHKAVLEPRLPRFRWGRVSSYKTPFVKTVNKNILIISNNRGREVGPPVAFFPSVTGVEGLENFPVLGVESTSSPIDDAR